MKPSPLPFRNIYFASQFQESHYRGVHIKISFYAFRLGEASITRKARGLKIRAATWCEWVYGRTWRQKKTHWDLWWFQTTRLPVKSRAFSNIPSQISAMKIMKIRLFRSCLFFLFSSLHFFPYTHCNCCFYWGSSKLPTYIYIYILIYINLGLMPLSFSTKAW